MGDFNDEPWSRSIRQTLNASFTREPMEEGIRLSRGTLPSWKSYAGRPVPLFNPMWSLLSEPDRGTRAGEQNQPLILTDQFFLSAASASVSLESRPANHRLSYLKHESPVPTHWLVDEVAPKSFALIQGPESAITSPSP